MKLTGGPKTTKLFKIRNTRIVMMTLIQFIFNGMILQVKPGKRCLWLSLKIDALKVVFGRVRICK